MIPGFDKEAKDDRIFVTIEKINRKSYDIVYYIKEKSGKLKRICITNEDLAVKDKDLEGFTNVEVRFIGKILKDEQNLTPKTLLTLKKNIHNWK